ncbi:ribonuclease H-like protein, partial [Mycena galericulata]
PIKIHISAANLKGGEADAIAGAGVYYIEDDPRNRSLRAPETLDQTTRSAELLGALVGVRQSPLNRELHIISNRDTMFKNIRDIPKWEDRGWFDTRDREPLKALLSTLRARTALTVFSQANGEEEKAGVLAAHTLAIAGTQKQTPDLIEMTAHPETELRGAKLAGMTQAIAYRTIKSLRAKVSRKATNENIGAVQLAVKLNSKRTPTAAAIWRSIKHKDITRQIRTFFWKSMHGALRIGKFWRNIPECEDRETCDKCNETESLEHIVLKCTCPGQDIVWNLAKDTGLAWPDLSLGGILGCGLAEFRDENNKRSPARTRLYTIVITESLHLIWKLRCERVIGRDGEPASEQEIHNRWIHAINERIEIDRRLTDKLKFGKQYYVAPSLVLETWKAVLKDKNKLPDDWLRGPEVLVGIAPKRSLRPP